MDAKEALYRWSKCENNVHNVFLQKWLEDKQVDGWASHLHIAGVEVTLDQYGVLAVIKGRILTFDRDSFSQKEKFCSIHLHSNRYGSFRCIGSVDIDGIKFSNLPNGMVNHTQIIFGKRKPNQEEGRKILGKAKNSNKIFYSQRIDWNTHCGQHWQLGEEWQHAEVAIRMHNNK